MGDRSVSQLGELKGDSVSVGMYMEIGRAVRTPLSCQREEPPGLRVAGQDNTLGEETFNRAKLLNVGYTEALKDAEYDCFIFSDLFSSCRLPYAGYFGGVSGLSKKQFLKINGFPNEYWGWGGEDDDIYNR
ncbi:unnamed protein product [Coregonus sp. 'balchen']|nr:unnamed protein product [Coregonus sp. 'balchen']